MVFAEIIYETGAHSIACYDSDEELLSAVSEHHKRAAEGGKASDGSQNAAERIVKVLKYDRHPADETSVSSEVALEEVKAAVEANSADGAVDVNALAAAVRELATPVVTSDPHESNYKLEEVEELDPESWAA